MFLKPNDYSTGDRSHSSEKDFDIDPDKPFWGMNSRKSQEKEKKYRKPEPTCHFPDWFRN